MASRHKTKVKVGRKTYAESHQNGEYDELDGDRLDEKQNPWAVPVVSDVEYDQVDILYDLYETLKEGRQKQILKLLLEGETNQVMIAKVLNMKQSNVNIEIQKIRKKAIALSYT